MKINDSWEIDDKVSGLSIRIISGSKLNRLRIRRIGKPIANNREFWFTKDGDFDGMGTSLSAKTSPVEDGNQP